MKSNPKTSTLKTLLTLSFIVLIVFLGHSQTPLWQINGNSISSGDWLGTSNNQDLLFKTNGNLALKIKANGNIIIKSFESAGSGLVTYDNNGKLIQLPFTSSSSQVLLGNGTFGTAPGTFWSAGTGSKIYYNGGKVGIGTSTPNYTLDVDGDLRVTNNLYLQGGLLISEKIETPKQMRAKAIVADSIMMDSTKAFYGESRFKGDVQLKFKLSVDGATNFNGSTAFNGSSYFNGSLTAAGNITFAGSQSIGYTPASGGSPAVYSFGPAIDISRPLSPCLSGLPTTIPLYQFHGMTQSYGTTPSGTAVTMSTGFDGANGIVDVAGTDLSGGLNPRLLINYYCGRDVYMCTGSSGKIVMATSSTGTVAIGEDYAPAGFKLAVKGKIISEDVTVKLRSDWPDYVFSKQYVLPDLKSVEKYIIANQHLPEIPSAEELKNTGGDVAELLRLQMKKIEELTLYLIEQNKKIEEQNNRIAILESNK